MLSIKTGHFKYKILQQQNRYDISHQSLWSSYENHYCIESIVAHSELYACPLFSRNRQKN